jgi:hypothetical protein
MKNKCITLFLVFTSCAMLKAMDQEVPSTPPDSIDFGLDQSEAEQEVPRGYETPPSAPGSADGTLDKAYFGFFAQPAVEPMELDIDYADESEDEEEAALLFEAARLGDIPTLQSLIAQIRNIDKFDDHERTPLMYAAARGHRDAVRLLVDAGADIVAHDTDGFSLLTWAVVGASRTAGDIRNNPVVSYLLSLNPRGAEQRLAESINYVRNHVAENL